MKPEHCENIRKRMKDYFDNVTSEQLEADLKRADFDYHNSLEDSPIVYSPQEKKQTT